MIEFTIADEADQQFATILNGRRVTIRLRYNVTTDRWSFDLAIDDEPVLHGRRIVIGVDLLKSFNLALGSLFALPVDSTNPGRTELPRGRVRLYHATEAEIAAALA